MVHTAGIFLIRKDLRFLVGHPTNHKPNFWGIPKGRLDKDEQPLEAAVRETYEETNADVSAWKIIHNLPAVKYKKSNKTLHAYALFETQNNIDFDSFDIKCNSFVPESQGGFPEMDEFKWVTIDEAREILHESQVACLDEIQKIIDNLNKAKNVR
jgi:8-oxo-dGTP pyrophosphatase MutT (NUDIX family)